MITSQANRPSLLVLGGRLMMSGLAGSMPRPRAGGVEVTRLTQRI